MRLRLRLRRHFRALVHAGAMSDTAAPARLYVGNIPWSTTIDELRDIFAECGGVRDVDIPTGRQGRSRGYGIVEFNTTEEAHAAVTRMDGTCGV